jgi:hypothetical protein
MTSRNSKRGVDALLTSRGKDLRPGESVSYRLVKGPSGSISADPVDPKAPRQAFPLVAKFPESVVRPDFTRKPWSDGRLYQQDVPKVADDSDDEATAAAKPKKRWRGMATNRPEATPRQWILQEQVDFLETMVARRENRKKNANGGGSRTNNNGKLSTRYEGTPESNPSAFALFLQSGNDIQVVALPPSSTVVFSQPAARKTLSLTEAEQAIQDQRMGIRSMRHLQSSDATEPGAGGGGTASGGVPTHSIAPIRRFLSNKNSSKARLMDKLKKRAEADDVEEADDVMGDVTFTNRKGKGGASGGGSARKELLETLGDGVTVSDEGVLGGANDALFGGRQRFASFQPGGGRHKEPPAVAGGGDESGTGGGTLLANEERGADGAAMADDFYQRDVQAEYEELDYDANEQFDDDDVDVGETEVAGDGDDDGYEQDDDDDDDDELDREEAVSGAEGLASVAGFKMMLAKARGEVQQERLVSSSTPDGSMSDASRKADEARQDEEGDHMAKIMAAAEKSAQALKEKAGVTVAKKPAAASAIQVDENGLRIINLDTVRNEIWLNQGSIPVKRLMKIFDVKKKSSAERQDKFREVIKELCAMKTDAVGGKILVLKQHYANMG